MTDDIGYLTMDMDVIKLARIILLADRTQWRCFVSGWQKLHKQRLPKKWTSTTLLSLKTYVFCRNLYIFVGLRAKKGALRGQINQEQCFMGKKCTLPCKYVPN